MKEGSPDIQFNHNPESKERDLKSLSFSELQLLSREVSELAGTSFKETLAAPAIEETDAVSDGFVNVNGRGIWIRKNDRGIYKVIRVSVDEFHPEVASNHLLRNGSEDKEQIVLEIREMIKRLGFRILE